MPWTRASVAPGALVAEGRAFYRADVATILPSIHVPTLVVGFRSDEGWKTTCSRTPVSSRSGSPARA